MSDSASPAQPEFTVPCKKCGQKKKIQGLGLCIRCYFRKRRAVKAGTVPDMQFEEPPDDLLPEPEPDTPLDEQIAAPNTAPMAQQEMDDLVARAASGALISIPSGGQVSDPNNPKGLDQMVMYLTHRDHVVRRKVIKQMLDAGMDELSIKIVFTTEPALRDRWITPKRDPLLMFDRDFNSIENDKRKARRNRASAQDAYLGEMQMLLRLSRELARDPKAPATVRNSALERIDKLAQQIAIMEGAIRVVPGQGVLPIDLPSPPDPADPADDDEDDDPRDLPGFTVVYDDDEDVEADEDDDDG